MICFIKKHKKEGCMDMVQGMGQSGALIKVQVFILNRNKIFLKFM
jgi:hypothetical protein